MLLTDKYTPTLEQIPQNTKPVYEYVTNYQKQKKKALMIHGPPGTGKTTAAYAIAKKLGYELVEINASDFRTAEEIHNRIGNAVKQMSLFANKKLILIDEVDGISGTEDRGGITAITEIIQNSKFPVLITANDPYEQKLNSLRSKCLLVEFPSIPATIMCLPLKRIIEEEKIKLEESAIKTIARRSGGDLRGAIIDIQTIASNPTPQNIDTLHEREKAENIMNALVKILKSTDVNVARKALDDVDQNIDESFLWIDENLPKEYTFPKDLQKAYDYLSKADVYRGRIRKWQYWRYLVYSNSLLTAGIATAKEKKQGTFVQYQRTGRLLKIWMANQKYARRKKIAQKVAQATHSSARKSIKQTLPLIYSLFQNNHPSAQNIIKELKLDEEEIEWLEK